MGIAGEIVQLLQFSEDGQVDLGTESALEFAEGGHLGLEQVSTQDVGAEERWSHNVEYRLEVSINRHYNKTSSLRPSFREDEYAASLLIKQRINRLEKPWIGNALMIKDDLS